MVKKKLGGIPVKCWGKALIIAVMLALAFCGFALAENVVVRMPNSLKTIEAQAFMDDTSLREVILPDGLETIGSKAFANSGVTRIYLPATLRSIASDAFSGCNVTAWGDYYAYARTYCLERGIPYECASPTNVSDFIFTVLSDGARARVDGYTGTALEVVIPPTNADGLPVTTIRASAFEGKNITSVSFPDTVTSIGMNAFKDCASLRRVYLPSSLTEIGSYAFENDISLENVHFPESLTSIRSYAFAYCDSLTEVRLPGTLQNNGYNSQFSHNRNLRRVVLSEGTESLPQSMFRDCPALTEVILPSTLKILDSYRFEDCTALKHIRIPEGMTDVRLQKTGISSVSDIDMPASVTALNLDGCPLTELQLPAHIKSISVRETPLKRVTLPNTVTTLPQYAFMECTQLTYAYIPDSVTDYSSSLFSGCTQLEEVRLPSNWTRLPSYVFSDCTSLPTVTLPASLTEIGDNVFCGCTSLKNLVIPGGVTNLSASAFMRSDGSGICEKLESLTIPRNTTLNGDFSQFPKLTLTVYYGSPAETFARENNIPYVVLEHPAVITSQPEDAIAAVGGSAIFNIAADHAKAYQWQVSKDGGKTWTNLSDTDSSLTVSVAPQSITWKYRCAVRGEDNELIYSQVAGIIQVVVGDDAEIYSVTPSVSQALTNETVTFTVETSLNIRELYLVAKPKNAYMWSLDYSAVWKAADCAVVSGDRLVWTVQYAFPYSSYSGIYFYGIGAVRQDDDNVLDEQTDREHANLTITPRSMNEVTELTGYLDMPLKEAAALTKSAIARDSSGFGWFTENSGVKFYSYSLSPARVQCIMLDYPDSTHTLYGVSNAMTLDQKRTKLTSQGWVQNSQDSSRYDSPGLGVYMRIQSGSVMVRWYDNVVFDMVQSTGLTLTADYDEYTIAGTGFDEAIGVQISFSDRDWEYLTRDIRVIYDDEVLDVYGWDDEPAGIGTINFNVRARELGEQNIRVLYFIEEKLYASVLLTINVVAPSSIEHTEVSGFFGKRLDRMTEEFPGHEIWMNGYFVDSFDFPAATKFRLDWRDQDLEWGSLEAPYGTGGYCVDMIILPNTDYYHSLFGLYTGMSHDERCALLEANGWTEYDDGFMDYSQASYINTSLGRIVEWGYTDIYAYMTPAAASAANMFQDIALFAMPMKHTVTKDVDEDVSVLVWFACKNPDKTETIADYITNVTLSDFTAGGFDTGLLNKSGAGRSPYIVQLAFKLKGLGTTKVTVTNSNTPYGTFTAQTVDIVIVAKDSWL